MASAIYPLAKQSFLSAEIDLTSDTIKAVLVADTYTYSASHQFLSDLGANTVGTAATLTSPTVTVGVFDAADVAFTGLSSTATANAVVVYDDTGTPSTSRLVCYEILTDGVDPAPVDLTNTTEVNITWDNGASKILAL